MVNDTFAEYATKKKKPVWVPFLAVAGWILAVVMTLGGLMIGGGLFALPGIGLGVALYFLIPRFNVEYEYTYVSGDLTIDKVINLSSRKTIVTLDFENVEIVADYAGHELDSYRNNPSTKVHDYSSHQADSKKFGIVSTDPEKKGLYVIEANDKLAQAIRSSYPRKFKNY